MYKKVFLQKWQLKAVSFSLRVPLRRSINKLKSIKLNKTLILSLICKQTLSQDFENYLKEIFHLLLTVILLICNSGAPAEQVEKILADRAWWVLKGL